VPARAQRQLWLANSQRQSERGLPLLPTHRAHQRWFEWHAEPAQRDWPFSWEQEARAWCVQEKAGARNKKAVSAT
jgi:hypothetical protein